jgi:hypothetical protein
MSKKYRRRGGFLGLKNRFTRDYSEAESGVWDMGDVSASNSAHPVGEVTFTGVGTSTFVIPDGVEYISGVCIGGGGGGMYYNASSSSDTYAMQGGGGGGLAWFNNLKVSEMEANNSASNPRQITIDVGAGGSQGAYSNGATVGGHSKIYWIGTGSSEQYIKAGGGGAGRYAQYIYGGSGSMSAGFRNKLLVDQQYIEWGLYSGGQSRYDSASGGTAYGPAGGGGAAGYRGNGGQGRHSNYTLGAGGYYGGGAGGGPAPHPDIDLHRSGGGGGAHVFGIFGKESYSSPGEYSGSHTLNIIPSQYSGAGSGGAGAYPGGAPSHIGSDISGGLYGGGGGGSSSVYFGQGGDGAQGIVRLMWGDGRKFPYSAQWNGNNDLRYSSPGNY